MQLITTTCLFHLQGWSPDTEHSTRMAKARSTSGLIGGCSAIRTFFEMAALTIGRFLFYFSLIVHSKVQSVRPELVRCSRHKHES